MLNVTSNLNLIIKAKLQQIQQLKNNPDAILRTIAMAVTPELKERVHVKGLDSSGSPIGVYSPSYMVIRTGNYKDAKQDKQGNYKIKKSEAKGDAGVYSERTITLNKKAGVFTGEDKVGKNRKVYNRTSDTKVVISLTRQMENDLAICADNPIKTINGYGIGYLNPENRKKADYVEATYNKKIFTKLTTYERELALKTAQDFIPEYLKTL